jgi:hypothetical protein
MSTEKNYTTKKIMFFEFERIELKEKLWRL